MVNVPYLVFEDWVFVNFQDVHNEGMTFMRNLGIIFNIASYLKISVKHEYLGDNTI